VDALLENIDGEILDAGFCEGFGGGVEDRGFCGILGDGFSAGAEIAMDAESALGPADNQELAAGLPGEKKVDLFAGAELGRAFDVGVQVLEFAAGLAHDDFFGEIALVVEKDAKTSPFSTRDSACMQRTRAMEYE
jgi:hypothetical protein